ncbi:MAG: copper resistance CopC family protein [Pseudonocardiaceae bacterium]
MLSWSARAAAATVLAAILAAAGAGPAIAHNELVRTTPAAGAVLDQPPAAVVLEFSEDIDPRFAEAAVTDAAGTIVSSEALRVDGSRLVQPVSLPRAGAYTVGYRVVSTDGHPVDGSVRFTTLAPTPGAAPLSSNATPSAAPDQRTGAVDQAIGSPRSAAGSWLPVAGIFGGLVVAAAALLVFTRHRRHTGEAGRDDDATG